MSAGMLELQSTSSSTVPSSSLSTHSRAVGNIVGPPPPNALRLATLAPPGEPNRPELLAEVLEHWTAEPGGAPGPAEAPVGPTASSEVDLLSSASGRLDVELLE